MIKLPNQKKKKDLNKFGQTRTRSLIDFNLKEQSDLRN